MCRRQFTALFEMLTEVRKCVEVKRQKRMPLWIFQFSNCKLNYVSIARKGQGDAAHVRSRWAAISGHTPGTQLEPSMGYYE